jgi:RNA polymerase subunit RPABC4/transcription elongation factor Spt4
MQHETVEAIEERIPHATAEHGEASRDDIAVNAARSELLEIEHAGLANEGPERTYREWIDLAVVAIRRAEYIAAELVGDTQADEQWQPQPLPRHACQGCAAMIPGEQEFCGNCGGTVS